MNVYFTASTTNDGKFKKNYQKIVDLIKRQKNHLLSGEQIVNEKFLELDKQLSKEQIFKREKKLIDEADCIIAEVSQPSLGVGGEIVYALVKGKPVLGLVFENGKDKISPMIEGNPSENFFFEHYNFEKLSYIIKDFLHYVKKAKKRKGYLIVIDGGNGSGKTTQTQLLVQYLKAHKVPAKYVDFPQYYNSFHGKTVARFLRGEFGKINEVSPYLASLAYAVDRASIKKEMEDFLHKGGFIIANRYATSSMAHQGAKFNEPKKREEFLKWLYELEYKVHRIPKENLVIYLHVPWRIGMQLTKNKGNRNYLQGKKHDIEEKDMNNRIESENMYFRFARTNKHWVMIECIEHDKLLPPKVIHEKIIKILKDKKYL